MTMSDLAPFNCDKVTEHLIVGAGLAGEEEVAWLASQGVTHIISAAAELNDDALASQHGLRALQIPWQDDGLGKPAGDFLHALTWVQNETPSVIAGGKQMGLYVHCAAGVHRGPLLATFLFAALSGLPGDTAWSFVKAARPVADAFNVPTYRQSCLDALHAIRPFGPLPLSAPPAAVDAPAAATATPSEGTDHETTSSAADRGGEQGAAHESLSVAVAESEPAPAAAPAETRRARSSTANAGA